MPRKAKDTVNTDIKNVVKKAPISKKSSSRVASSSNTTSTAKKVTKTAKKSTNTKNAKSASATKSNTKKATKKAVNRASTTKSTNKRATKSSTKKVSTKKTTTKKQKKVEIIEYYDLPYRYNQTVVKIIAQTPTTLFVYWDVSDEDKKAYIEQYGEYFYNNTKPVLVVHNLTKNYSFEIDINDYANSWYLKVNDSKCDYKIELGRRGINKFITLPNNYLYISSSNELEVPNDHILFENIPNKICFKNIKTGEISIKDISSISFLKSISKIYNTKEFYKLLYENKNFAFEEFNLNNPSSGNPSSKF